MSTTRTARSLAPLLLALPLAFTACSPSGEGAPSGEAPQAGLTLPNPLPKPDFSFTGVDGQPYAFKEKTAGYVTLLFFGYTNCPDICPVTMATLASALGELPAEARDRVRVVFVSTDPQRDTPERIGEWLGTFDPTFVGLRGPLDQVHALESSLLLPPSMMAMDEHQQESADSTDYQVGHASLVVAFGADGLARHMYPGDTTPQIWQQELSRMVGEMPATTTGS